MAKNKGKAFEEVFKKNFKESFPDGTIDRIYDTTNGYKTISNISDFIGNTPLVEISGLEGQKARMDRPCQRIQCDTHYA